MISFFIPIAEALIAGYFGAVATYMVLLFAITRLGRFVLLKGNGASPAYTALHTLAWALAAGVGAYLCSSLSPLAPYGTLGFPIVLAVALALVAIRNFRQLPGQMSGTAIGLIVLAIVGGTWGALHLQHAFVAFKS